MVSRIILLLAAVLMFSEAKAERIDPKRPAALVTPLMKSVPVIDGIIHEDEWRDATRAIGFIKYLDATYCTRSGTFWFGCDGKRVYVAVRSELPPVGELQTTIFRKDGDVSDNDDAVEIWLHPRFARTKGDRRYLQFIGNSAAYWMDLAYETSGGQSPWDGDWDYKCHVGDGVWQCEASVSMESIGAEAQDMSSEWRVHVARAWRSPLEFAAWSSTTMGFSSPECMTSVRWDAAAPIVQVRSMGDLTGSKKIDAQVNVRNPTESAVKLNVKIDVQPINQPEFGTDETIELAPGEDKTVVLRRDFWPSRNYGQILVTGADGATTYFRRSFAWDPVSGPTWHTVKKDVKPVELITAYYPYHGKVRARVNLIDEIGSKVSGATISVAAGDGTWLCITKIAAFGSNSGDVLIDLPELRDGTYTVDLKLHGDDVPAGPFTQTFEHKTWGWERNQIGKSRMVIPPFTPLKVNGANVEAVLRSHTVNGWGLWDQVIAKDQPLLASPIRLEIAGAKLSAARFTEKSDDRVVSESHFDAGALRGQTNSEWDYDGMMKVTLELDATNQSVDSLDLLIPLRGEVATLMHASSDGIRANPTRAIPAGDGVVWDSTKTIRYKTLGTWIPYVWLGGTERGICFFSDSDRDWSLDDNKPAIEIVRDAGAVTLRVHLINKPTKLDRPRRIVFGLQATPVKPMPEGWRGWNFVGIDGPHIRPMRILGQGQYWGAATAYSDVYPRNRDFSIFEKFAEVRRTGVVDQAFIEQWVKGYEDQSKATEMRNDVTHGMSRCVGNHPIIPYTNARGGSTGPEGAYFAAESFNSEPVESFRDFALFYFKKMMDLGVDGIYFDNTYLEASGDTIGGGAYVRDDGQIQPGVGLWSMREYLKRVAVMYHEAGKQSLTVVHMTNGYIIPALSFATIALDWEDKAGAADFQDRFSNEFILAESTGLQAGLVPLALSLINTPDEKVRARAVRTQFAVAALHEVKTWGSDIGHYYRLLYHFGYAEPDCKVYRYWDESQPVTISGQDAKALVLSRAGKSMILLSSFDEGGTARVRVNTSALGLRSGFSATNVETGDALPVSDQTITIDLPHHDMRLIAIE